MSSRELLWFKGVDEQLIEDYSHDKIQLLRNEKFQSIVDLILKHNELGGDVQLPAEDKDIAPMILFVSATFTQLFVIDNFTGPINKDLRENLPEFYMTLSDKFDYSSLSIDSSDVYHKTTNPWLLKMVQLAWKFLPIVERRTRSRHSMELEYLFWKHRYLTVHLALCLEPPESLVVELRKIQEFIFDHYIIEGYSEDEMETKGLNIVELCCELIQSGLLRDAYKFCHKVFEYSCEISGVNIEHTGALGKRTRFQQKDIPQLLIRVKRTDTQVQLTPPDRSIKLPKDIDLDDDTLLPDVAFVNEDDSGETAKSNQDISIEEQLLMLTNLNYLLKTEVTEESLKDEWTLAYVRSIIKSASVWSIKYKALAIRSQVERKHMRKMDRALLQLEELIKVADKSDQDDNQERLTCFYSSLPLARWQMQRSLGDISFELCLYKNALDVYTRIEYWEGIIKCHSALGETTKAEKLIRQELVKHETPYLYCLLGDATDEIGYYEKSWSLSNGRFARAKKSLGTYFYVRKQYEKAIEHYEQARSANPSNISILSLLAYSYLTLEQYEKAAECYRNITYHDDTNFLVWNNLSKAYIKLGQKERAWRTLKEAIKCNYEEWKVWDNLMFVSMDVGALDDVITAWHRIIDIKSTHKDDQILSALTYSVIKRSYAKLDDIDVGKTLSDCVKLVARLNSTGACSSRSWICYFRLLLREHELANKKEEQQQQQTKLDIDARISKITTSLQRATPTSTVSADPNWYQSLEKIDHILESYDELLDCYALAIETLGPRKEIWSQWKNFKLSAANVLKTLKQKGYNDN